MAIFVCIGQFVIFSGLYLWFVVTGICVRIDVGHRALWRISRTAVEEERPRMHRPSYGISSALDS
jgi:hypothetical protein